MKANQKSILSIALVTALTFVSIEVEAEKYPFNGLFESTGIILLDESQDINLNGDIMLHDFNLKKVIHSCDLGDSGCKNNGCGNNGSC